MTQQQVYLRKARTLCEPFISRFVMVYSLLSYAVTSLDKQN